MSANATTTHESPLSGPYRADRRTAADADRSQPGVWLVLSMLLLTTLPDGMVPPVLKGLFVDRYGVSAGAAHWFMAINLIGALLALPVLARLRRRVSPAGLIAYAAGADALLLVLLAGPIGFVPSLAVRLAEGAVDVMVVAVLFDLVSKSGPAAMRGRRFGLAGTVLLLSLGIGLVVGGVVGHAVPPLVFLCGALGCAVVAISAVPLAPRINGLVRLCPAAEVIDEHTSARDMQFTRRRIWPAAAMTCGDRMLAGVMTATVPLFLSQVAAIESVSLGALLAIPLTVMALGAWPAGRLGDRVGHPTLRTTAAVIYAAGFAAIALLDQPSMFALLVIMFMLGVAGAALMPTAFAIGSQAGHGSVGMAQMHVAGNVGYFVSIATAGGLLSVLGGRATTSTDYIIVILSFVGAYLVFTLCSTIGVRRNERIAIAMERSRVHKHSRETTSANDALVPASSH